MTIPKQLQSILAADPEILSGAVRFKGTRVPVQALLDTIIGGESVDYFVDDFPDVAKEQALAFLRWEQIRRVKCLASNWPVDANPARQLRPSQVCAAYHRP